MEKKSKERCKESVKGVDSWSSHICNKPAKGYLADGTPACGIHLRAERQREEWHAKWKKEWDACDVYKREVEDFCTKHGIEAKPQTISSNGAKFVTIEWSLLQKLVKNPKS